VRMWQEPSHLVSDQWRGSVEHVPSAQRIYFTSLADLNDFITWRLNSPLSPGASQSMTDETSLHE
jgi:hypothetical protein